MALGVAGAAPRHAGAQDILARARSAPTRAQSLALLEAHLATAAGDVDARTLYGLMLSWDGRYDEARRELTRVIAQAPEYTDARAGLMNVEWWSGRVAQARAHSDYILRRDPGHPQARLVRQRLAASDRPWTVGVALVADTFSDDRDAWHEEGLTVTRQTPAGALIARASRARRFGSSDEQFEIEFYPVFRPGTYALVAAGASPDHALYPSTRLALEIYQAIGRGFEASAGYRRLAFDASVHVYGGSLSKYAGSWLTTVRVTQIDARGADGGASVQVQTRRYFGADGTSFAGVGYFRGLNRDEIRGEGDVVTEDTDTVRAELSTAVSSRMRLLLDARTSRVSRGFGTLWQHTAGAGAAFRF